MRVNFVACVVGLVGCRDPQPARSNPTPTGSRGPAPEFAELTALHPPTLLERTCLPAERTVEAAVMPAFGLDPAGLSFVATDVIGDRSPDLIALGLDSLRVWDGVPTGPSSAGPVFEAMDGPESWNSPLTSWPDLDGDGRAELVMPGDGTFALIAMSADLEDPTTWREIYGQLDLSSNLATGSPLATGLAVVGYGRVDGRDAAFVFAPPPDLMPITTPRASITTYGESQEVAVFDLDGDGVDEVWVGHNTLDVDRLLGFRGPVSGDLVEDDAMAAWTGTVMGVTGLGDPDGDGHPELGVVMDYQDADSIWHTRVLVTEHDGIAAATLEEGAQTIFEGEARETFDRVDPVGDVDGDDRDDYAISGERVWLIAGAPEGQVDVDTRSILEVPSTRAVAAGLGDLDHDGLADLLLSDFTTAWFVSGAVAACEGYQAWYDDADRDGYADLADPSATVSATPVDGASPVATDCNDGDATVNPAAVDPCAGGTDRDCDGQAECHVGDLAFSMVRGGFGDLFGTAIAPAGDLDGDGDEDVVIVSNLVEDPSGSTVGAWSVVSGPWQQDMDHATTRTFLGTPDDSILPPIAVGALQGMGRHDVAWTDGTTTFLASLDDPTEPASSGPGAHSSHLAAADLTGDGVAELVSSNRSCWPFDDYPPCVSVSDGPLTSLDVDDARVRVALSAEFGEPITAAVGDLDGDGREDLALGQPYEAHHGNLLPTEQHGQGVVWWWTAIDGASGLLHAADVAVASYGRDDEEGVFVPVALGDVDGDGRDDVLVHPRDRAGLAYVILGPGASGVYEDVAVATVAVAADAVAVGRVDVDRDGAADALVGADDGLAIAYGPLAGALEPPAFAGFVDSSTEILALAPGAWGPDGAPALLVGVPYFGRRSLSGAVFAVELDALHTAYQASLGH